MAEAIIIFRERDGTEHVARADTVFALIKKYGLRPHSSGAYKFTNAMVKEALAIDALSEKTKH